MSRTYRDGRNKGAHRKRDTKEIWSARCPDMVGQYSNRFSKRETHRHERRAAKEETRRLDHD